MKSLISIIVLFTTFNFIAMGVNFGTYTLNQTDQENATLDPGFVGIGSFSTFNRTTNLSSNWASFNSVQYLETYPWTTSSSLDPNQRCEFTVTLNSPNNFNGLSMTLEFYSQIWYINANDHGPLNGEVLYRFGTSGSFLSAGTWSPSQNTWGNHTFSIPTDNTNKSSIEIRIHAWNAGSNQWLRQLWLRDVVLNGSSLPLPVELKSFTAHLIGKSIVLKWQTESEKDNYGFDVERRTNDKSWEKIGFVAGNGNSNSPKNYSYTDKTAAAVGKYSYRLKQIEANGSYSYSKEVEVEVGTPTDFALEQNYPNPFNPATRISYQLPIQSHVQIDVFNSIGEKVAVLVNEVKEAGYYEIEFNAASLSSGIYFYSIRANEFLNVRKMTVVK